ncbi:MAG: hypothetical protein ACKO04_16975 [Actinomycetes bacterium]
MAEPIYPSRMEVRTSDDVTEVWADSFGPAGTSAVELPDGTVWEVDHADPGVLVSLRFDGELEMSRLARDLLGDKRFDLVCAELDAQRAAKRPGATLRAVVPGRRAALNNALAQRRSVSRGPARLLGGSVVSADLMGDPTLPAVVRAAAGLELLSQLRDGASEQLLGHLRPDTVGRVAELARAVAPDDVAALGPRLDKPVHRLHAMAGWARGEFSELDLPLRQFMDLLDGYDGFRGDAAALRASRPWAPLMLERQSPGSTFGAPDGSWAGEVHGAPVLPPDEFQRIERDGPGQVVVHVGRHHEGRWVRVLRVSGLTPLAVAPLEPDGVLLRARVVVPPDLDLEDLMVEVLDETELTAGPRPLALVRGAVETGRNAARLERLGQPDLAAGAWMECARLWALAEDPGRASLAERRAGLPQGVQYGSQGQALLADELLDGTD